jgi:hypothetical protein
MEPVQQQPQPPQKVFKLPTGICCFFFVCLFSFSKCPALFTDILLLLLSFFGRVCGIFTDQETINKVKAIIKKEFSVEIESREKEVSKIEKRLEEARSILEKLKHCLAWSTITFLPRLSDFKKEIVCL